jgi:hypothetical protein
MINGHIPKYVKPSFFPPDVALTFETKNCTPHEQSQYSTRVLFFYWKRSFAELDAGNIYTTGKGNSSTGKTW